MKKTAILACVAVALIRAAGSFGAIYYVSPAGSDSNPGTEAQPWRTVQKTAGSVEPGDTVLIREGTYHEHVVVQRSGSTAEPITFANYPGETPVIDCNGLGSFGGIFECYYADHIRISGLRVVNGNSAGIWTKYADDVVIENCSTYNTTSSGVKIKYSNDIVVRGNEIEQACLGGSEECITVKQFSDGVLVQNNHIHNCMKEGLDIKEGARNVQVVGNHIHNVERQGMYADAWNVPTFNIVYRDNIVHDCGFGFGACSEMGGLLSNVWFVNNLVYNCTDGPGMFCKDWGGDTAHPIQDVYYINNTVYNCAWGWGAGMDIGTYEANNVVVRNNIISNCGQAIQVNREPLSKTIEYNLCESTAGLDPNWVIAGLPRFVNAPGGDFCLLANSDAIDAGGDENAPDVDLDGDPRPMGYGFDIGAYEWPLGDIDGDGHLDYADFAILGYQWGEAPGDPNGDIAPLGGDGVVDRQDLAELVVCWPK